MSRWRRKSNDAESGGGTADAVPEFTDVKIVKREPTSSEPADGEESDRDETDDGVLAELSVAFGDDDSTSGLRREAAPFGDDADARLRQSIGLVHDNLST